MWTPRKSQKSQGIAAGFRHYDGGLCRATAVISYEFRLGRFPEKLPVQTCILIFDGVSDSAHPIL